VRHLENPRQLVEQSIMPAYPHLLKDNLDFEAIQQRVDGMAMIGVPYGEAVKPGRAAALAHEQAKKISTELVLQGGYPNLEEKQIIALVAYLQRIGTDISAPPAEAAPAPVKAEAAPTPGNGG
jgi:cytochrome c oxidase cbb3-type subunit I/II